jgi:hypothetical protein
MGLIRKPKDTQICKDLAVGHDPETIPQGPMSEQFTLFPNLPPEIRNKIWVFASVGALMDLGSCVLSLDHYRKREKLPMVRFEARSLLSTSREARMIALREEELLPFNTAFDILYIENSTLGKLRATLRDNHEIPEWILRTEHIAVPFGHSTLSEWLPHHLSRFPELRRISIVFPRPSGPLWPEDSWIRLTPWQREHPSIQSLTWKEGKKIKFALKTMSQFFPNKYTRDGQHRKLPMVSSISASEYVRCAEEDFNRAKEAESHLIPQIRFRYIGFWVGYFED